MTISWLLVWLIQGAPALHAWNGWLVALLVCGFIDLLLVCAFVDLLLALHKGSS